MNEIHLTISLPDAYATLDHKWFVKIYYKLPAHDFLLFFKKSLGLKKYIKVNI